MSLVSIQLLKEDQKCMHEIVSEPTTQYALSPDLGGYLLMMILALNYLGTGQENYIYKVAQQLGIAGVMEISLHFSFPICTTHRVFKCGASLTHIV